MPNINLFYYLIAGCIFGALALKTGIPAAPLAGASSASATGGAAARSAFPRAPGVAAAQP